MNTASIKKKLRQNEAPVFIMYGDEPYFMDEIADFVDKELVPEEHKAFNYHMFFGKDSSVEQIIDAARRVPMGAPHQHIMIKEAQNLPYFDQLENYVMRPTPSTRLYLFYKKKLDGRKAISKLLKSKALAFESKSLYDNAIQAWLQGKLEEAQISYDRQAIALLTEYMGTNLARHVDALEKLKINLEEGQKLTADRVHKLIGVKKEYDSFALQSAVAQKNRVVALEIINHYASDPKKNPLVLIVTSLHRYFSSLVLLQSKGARNEGQVKSITNSFHRSAIRDYLAGLKAYSFDQSKKALHLIHLYDLKAKGQGARNMNHEAFLKELVSKILT